MIPTDLAAPERLAQPCAVPRASVIIPTWNACDMLLAALSSLERQTWRDFEIIVVDNGSSDSTHDRLAAEHPHVRILRFEENRGFAAAVNAGIKAASGDVIVLMNNDTEAGPGWLSALLRVLDEHPAVSACASRMLDYHDPDRIDSVGIQLGLFASNIGHAERNGAPFNEAAYVLAPCGGAAAYRRSALDDVGLFDESFFAYFEDVDLGVRMQLAGHRCMYVPEAVIYHHGSATSDRMPAMRYYLLMRNALTIFFRYMPLRRLVWSPVVICWPFVRAIIDRQPQRLALRALLDFLCSAPSVLRERRRIRSARRISTASFTRMLASPIPPTLRRGDRPGRRMGRIRRREKKQ